MKRGSAAFILNKPTVGSAYRIAIENKGLRSPRSEIFQDWPDAFAFPRQRIIDARRHLAEDLAVDHAVAFAYA